MEKSQEQIIFENTCMNLKTGDFRGYPFGSIGNVVHWLRALGLIQYDVVQIGFNNNVGTVILWGKIIATYRLVEDLEMPMFIFINEYNWLGHTQNTYIEGLKKFEDPYKQYDTKPVKHNG